MNSGISCASNRELLEAASARGYGEPRRPKRSEVGGRRAQVTARASLVTCRSRAASGTVDPYGADPKMGRA
jgi:hypothetical protein